MRPVKEPTVLRLTFLGTSSGVPSLTRNVSGLAVQTHLGRAWLLVDCGEGTQHQVQRAGLSLHDLQAVCISHVHGDHCFGLPGLLASAGMNARTAPLQLIAPEPVWRWLQTTFECTDTHLPYPLHWIDVADPAAWQWQPSISISRHAQQHRVPSYAFRIDCSRALRRLKTDALHALGLPPGPAWKALSNGQDVPFDGRTLHSADWVHEEVQHIAAVLGGDNAEPACLQAACEGAQLLVHEATYAQAVLDKVGPGPMHSSVQLVATFAQQQVVPNLVLTHFSPRHHTSYQQQVLRTEAQAHYQGQVFLAQDFDVFELAFDGTLTHHSPAKPAGASSAAA